MLPSVCIFRGQKSLNWKFNFNSMNVHYLCRGISVWITFVTISITALLITSKNADKRFYKVGPHKDFLLMGFVIDNGWKYMLIVLYSLANTVVRTLQHEVLSPWLVNNVQDLERELHPDTIKHAFEVTSISTLYQWVDWLLYMNILLSQIDMVIVEVVMNLIASNTTTYLYIKYNKRRDHTETESFLRVK